MLSYALLHKLQTYRTHEGDPFPTGGLERWVFSANLRRLDGISSLTLVVEATESYLDPVWRPVHTFTLTEEGESVVYTWDGPHGVADADGTVGPWVRAHLTAVVGTGTYVLDCFADGVAFDPQEEADVALLPPEVRTWSELARVTQEAEVALRGHLGGIRDLVGRLRARAWDPDFEETLRVAIARQVVYLAAREKAPLEERMKYVERVIAPDVEIMVRPLLDDASEVWRGR